MWHFIDVLVKKVEHMNVEKNMKEDIYSNVTYLQLVRKTWQKFVVKSAGLVVKLA